jgi:predicted metal-dependent hydrolase
MRRCARGRKGRGVLARRYGCFRLPRVKGASEVSEAKRKDVSWFARTDVDSKEIEFSKAFDELSPEGKRYIVLHERAHLKTGPVHDARFYDELKKLVENSRGVSWKVAYELESYNCEHKS